MKLKLALLALVIQLFTLTCFAQKQEPNCNLFHVGNFKIYSQASGTTYIKRTATEQTEINEPAGFEVIFSIKWIDECNYELRVKKVIKGDPKFLGDRNNYIRNRIKNITEKGYVAEVSSNVFKGTMDIMVELDR